YRIEFDDVILPDERGSTNSFQLIEGAEGYFRLLTNTSYGNPRLATHLWLQSLEVRGNKTLRVGLFREPSAEIFNDMGDELLFALGAICQHENLSPEELALTLNLSSSFADFAITYLLEYGFIEPKNIDQSRFTLSPKY